MRNIKNNQNALRKRPRYIRLSPFEEYMVCDQRHGFPMTQEMIWVFRGTFDEDLLRRAFWTAAAAEPLCGATIRRRFGRLYWDLDTQKKP